MKKNKFLLSIISILILTGCAKYSADMKINEDKTVDLHMKYGLLTNFVVDSNEINQEEEMGGVTTNVDADSYKILKEHGYTIEEYSEKLEDGTTSSGIEIFKKFNSLDDITSDSKIVIDFLELFSNKDDFNDSKFFYKEDGKYNADFLFNFEMEGDFDSDALNNYKNMLDLKYSISFPEEVKYITSNANNVSEDGKTLTWNFDINKKNKVEFSFSYDYYISKIDKIIIISCIGIIGSSMLLIIIVMLTKIKDKNKIKIEDANNENENNQEESNK